MISISSTSRIMCIVSRFPPETSTKLMHSFGVVLLGDVMDVTNQGKPASVEPYMPVL
jgi:hypothetical protein